MILEFIVKFALGALTVLGVVVIVAYPFMWLWNYLMPDIFGLIELTIKQSIGLIFLAKMIFGNN